ncbi:hypothetical protein Emtol_0394 [Emticicia oligotrophica DSM 17448]|uniref:RND transporter n=1 Tax=Emticicia oligotrophica (strain DSM 17448 / CIP 109782 / MTCC 6937 / GPTSA100-15) TaxID=929562 RepID=A0ABM5MWT8_EMTOG|nr:hypothetical protein [Emticicia oligotrophica]AFK01548.1 hypothetical protein Emtol_0394 [Emticicia oligotrophica DSM 17448]
MKETLNNWKLWLAVSLTLGLAPFFPEPHLVGKIRWVMGGAVGMQAIDWYDLVQHGFPFIFLLRALYINFSQKKQ